MGFTGNPRDPHEWVNMPNDKAAEEWRPIPGYSGYEISRAGVVRHVASKEEAETIEAGESYCYILNKDGYERVRAIRPLMHQAYPELVPTNSERKEMSEKIINFIQDELNIELQPWQKNYISSSLTEMVLKKGWQPNGRRQQGMARNS
jgi:hypothetical protein